jgi:Na+-driven multidrug efflux pump
LREHRDSVYYGFFIMTAFDFWQVILAGTFRALEKVDLFSKFNIVTYFVIILPVSSILAFYVGTHTDYTNNKVVPGEGQMGTWHAFWIGLIF